MTTPDQTASAATIQNTVTDKVGQTLSDGTLSNVVVDVFVKRENDRRVDLLVKAIDALAALNATFTGINKPDDVKFSSAENDAKPVEQYSPKRKQEIASAKKKIDELSSAISAALTSAAFDALDKALKKIGNKDAPASE